MTFEEMLKSLELEEDKIAAIKKGMADNKIYTTAEENIDERYSKLKTQKETLENEVQTKDSLINDLKNDTQANETLQTKITEYETQLEELKTQSAAQAKQAAVDLTLVKAGARNPKAVNALLKLDDVEVTDAGIKGLDEQLTALKESDAYLFESDVKNPAILNDENPNGTDDQTPNAFEDVLKKYD